MLDDILDVLLDNNVKVTRYIKEQKRLIVNKYITILGYDDSDDLVILYYNECGILKDIWCCSTNIFTAEEIVDDISMYCEMEDPNKPVDNF